MENEDAGSTTKKAENDGETGWFPSLVAAGAGAITSGVQGLIGGGDNAQQDEAPPIQEEPNENASQGSKKGS